MSADIIQDNESLEEALEKELLNDLGNAFELDFITYSIMRSRGMSREDASPLALEELRSSKED